MDDSSSEYNIEEDDETLDISTRANSSLDLRMR
jgi:hypothetical protein